MSVALKVEQERTETPAPGNSRGSSRIRRFAAVVVLCALGMLVVNSLFASPAERFAYRPAAAPVVRSPSPTQPIVRVVNDRRVIDHC